MATVPSRGRWGVVVKNHWVDLVSPAAEQIKVERVEEPCGVERDENTERVLDSVGL
jgi:hypothetical protein